MLTSNRKFGVEIEFVAPTSEALSAISRRINCVADGSLRPLRNAAEYVSPVLSGAHGVLTIQQACEVLKKHGASCTDPKTSVHIHLDGRKKGSVLRASKTRDKLPANVAIVAVSNRAKPDMKPERVQQILESRAPLPMSERLVTSDIDNILYISRVRLTRAPRINYTYYWIEKPNRVKWLRNVLYFYTQYSDVMEKMVSNSRRFGNMYCIPLGKSYDLPLIEACQSEEELRNVWYKGRGSGGHYDDSRYHNVNLHSYWDRHGTVEIRCHGGTIDPYKILLWLRLHQKIVDKLEDIDLDDIKFSGDVGEMCAKFVEFVEEPILCEYVQRLLGYYSGISIK